MAVVLTATPNPVVFTQAQVAAKARRTVSLSWGTGNPAVAASLFRSANADPESPLAGAANKPAATGTVVDDLGYSDTIVYTLRDTAKRALAQVTVRTALSIPTPPPPPPRPTQDIRDVRVIARGDLIWLTFGTNLPSSPWVELVDDADGALAGYWARPDIGTRHSMMFDGIGSPLLQAHQYRFRIVAERSAPVDALTNPQLSGRIVTGTRQAVVRFVGASLAPRSQGPIFDIGVNFSFYGAAGDVDAWTVAGHRTLADPMTAGGSIFIDEQITMAQAGRTLWASLAVQHRNSSVWKTYFSTDLSQEPSVPPTPGVSGWTTESETVEQSAVYVECHPTLRPGPDAGPLLPLTKSHRFTVGNANSLQAYQADVLVEVTLTDGRWNFDGWSPERMRLYRFSHAAVTSLSPGLVTALRSRRTTSTMLALAPTGHLAVTHRQAATASSAGTTSSHLLPGSIRSAAAVAGPEGEAHIVGVDDAGRVLSTHLTATGEAPTWTDLRLDDATQVTLASGDAGLHVVALTSAGRLCQALASPDPRWAELAEGVRACAVIGAEAVAPAIVAVTTDGAVRHLTLGPDGVGDGEWTDLGTTAPGVVAVATHDDSSVSVLVLADDGPAALLAWPDYPHPGLSLDWQPLGDHADLVRGAASADELDPDLGRPSEI